MSSVAVSIVKGIVLLLHRFPFLQSIRIVLASLLLFGGLTSARHLYLDTASSLFERASRNESSLNTGRSDPAGNQTVDVPLTNGGRAWGAAYKKARGVVQQMTLEEKVNA